MHGLLRVEVHALAGLGLLGATAHRHLAIGAAIEGAFPVCHNHGGRGQLEAMALVDTHTHTYIYIYIYKIV